MVVLIVEDDPVISITLETLVAEVDIEPVVAITVTTKAEALLELMGRVDLAILDVEVTNGETFDIAEELKRLAVPFVFVSGSDPSRIPAPLRHAPFVPKPFDEMEIRAHVEEAVRGLRAKSIDTLPAVRV